MFFDSSLFKTYYISKLCNVFGQAVIVQRYLYAIQIVHGIPK